MAGGRPLLDAAADITPDRVEAGRAPGVTCPPVTGGQMRGLGACCVAATDCVGGICWNGFCTKTCLNPGDCGPVVAPSPLPLGTDMACAKNQVGDSFTYCLPGSLAVCGGPGAAPCPAGEACALSLNPAATQAVPASAYAGACMTTLVANAYQPVGSECQPEDGPYACENQGGYLGSGCLAHRCTQACAADANCPIGMQCEPPPYSAKLGGAASFLTLAGTGVCLGRFCGQVHGDAGLAPGQGTQFGSDASCVGGSTEVCVPTISVGATGDTQYLSCVPARPRALGFGVACSLDPAQNQRCADDSLCVDRGGSRFCSKLCRADADCPSGAFCIDDYPSPVLPNGSVAHLGMCTPRALIAGTSCRTETTCAATQACLPAGGHSNLLVCRAAVGTKSVGASCAAAAECRSGSCVDRDLRSPSGSNRTYCGGYCGKNSDCGANQICLRVVTNNNMTVDDPRDDTVVGFCTPLDAPSVAGGCMTDANCTGQISIGEIGGDTCDLVHNTCYKKAARIGDACAHRANCPLGAYCRLADPRFSNGACLSLGCDPTAVSGVDACPTGSTCAQRTPDVPLYGCYEACTTGMTCSRMAEGYVCDVAISGQVPGQVPSICLSQGGP